MSVTSLTSPEAFDDPIAAHQAASDFYFQAAHHVTQAGEKFRHYLHSIDANHAARYEEAIKKVADRFTQQAQVQQVLAHYLTRVKQNLTPVDAQNAHMFMHRMNVE